MKCSLTIHKIGVASRYGFGERPMHNCKATIFLKNSSSFGLIISLPSSFPLLPTRIRKIHQKSSFGLTRLFLHNGFSCTMF